MSAVLLLLSKEASGAGEEGQGPPTIHDGGQDARGEGGGQNRRIKNDLICLNPFHNNGMFFTSKRSVVFFSSLRPPGP